MITINNLQNEYLSLLQQNQSNVSIYLINGIKLTGLIAKFDDSAILLRDTNKVVEQLILKHAISTIVPSKSIINNKQEI